MRYLSAILLLSCFCFLFLGYHIAFRFQLDKVKSEMKASLKNQKEHKDVLQIFLSEDEAMQVCWEEENEFRYNEEMYDVIEKKLQGKGMLIRCIQDEKETELLNEYQKNRTHNPENSIVQLIVAQFDLPHGTFLQPPEGKSIKAFADPSFYIPRIVLTVYGPPPDVC